MTKIHFSRKPSIFFTFILGLIVATSIFAQTERHSTSQPLQMRIASFLSLGIAHPFNSVALPRWMDEIAKVTEGRVIPTIEYFKGFPLDIINQVYADNYDAAWIVNGYFPSKFKLTSIAELPTIQGDNETLSIVYWRTYQKYFLKNDEFNGLYLAALFVYPKTHLIATYPITSLADVREKKIRVGGYVAKSIIEKLGGIPVFASATELYSMVYNRVVYGSLIALSELKYLSLSEVTKSVYEFPEGINRSTFSIFIGKKFMDRLSEKDRLAIESTCGEKLCRLMSKYWSIAEKAGEDEAQERGVHITKASDTDEQTILRIGKELEETWVSDMRPYNANAQKALEEFKVEVRHYNPIPH